MAHDPKRERVVSAAEFWRFGYLRRFEMAEGLGAVQALVKTSNQRIGSATTDSCARLPTALPAG